eukprot:1158104-Pelagomonas_calceolata.AAC.8
MWIQCTEKDWAALLQLGQHASCLGQPRPATTPTEPVLLSLFQEQCYFPIMLQAPQQTSSDAEEGAGDEANSKEGDAGDEVSSKEKGGESSEKGSSISQERLFGSLNCQKGLFEGSLGVVCTATFNCRFFCDASTRLSSWFDLQPSSLVVLTSSWSGQQHALITP